MRKTNISIFVPHIGCPQKCSFCNQNTITGQAKPATVEDVVKAVETAIGNNKDGKFKYEIASYIAKYAVAMNGVDYIVFTGGVGENQINIRRGICEKLEFMGVKIDVDANNMRGEEKEISTPDSKIKVYVVPTNEELMIAKETARLV